MAFDCWVMILGRRTCNDLFVLGSRGLLGEDAGGVRYWVDSPQRYAVCGMLEPLSHEGMSFLRGLWLGSERIMICMLLLFCLLSPVLSVGLYASWISQYYLVDKPS